MLSIEEVVIVEGNYDKHTLSQIVDAIIITTDGFTIFESPKKMELIRRYAKEKGIVILTDSDSAGFIIRKYLKQSIDPALIKNAYIPEILGKEKRKASPSKEGLLGVEGTDSKIIIDALVKAGCKINDEAHKTLQKKITKSDLYEDNLLGKANSSKLRRALSEKLNLPLKISTNGLLEALNAFYEYDEYKAIIRML